ncbi:MAG: DNA polymerase IV [Thermoproteota archaeon]
MNNEERIVAHVDMDHFFTAVEVREHPEWEGEPVVVGADPEGGAGRGVVSTCNYQAREFGVRSGMPISRAWKLCPQAVYRPVNRQLYRRVSHRIMDLLRGYTQKFEQWGIDEAFLDLTSRVEGYQEAAALAQQIQQQILEQEGLTCSIGLGPNKLVAKIASDYRKPDGLTVVKEEEVKRFLAPLPVRKLLWVGRKTEQRLNSMEIETIGDLAGYDPTVLKEEFGVTGTQLYLMAHGVDDSEVEENGEAKSISRESTFKEDTADHTFILQSLDNLSEQVMKKVEKQEVSFKTVTVKVRYEDFETHTHRKTHTFPTDRLQDLQETARKLIRKFLKSERKIRLIGVKVSNFISAEKQQKLI